MIAFIVGVGVGALATVFTMSLCYAAHDADKKAEEMMEWYVRGADHDK